MHQVFLAVIRRFLKANFKKSIVLSYDKGSAFRDESASFFVAGYWERKAPCTKISGQRPQCRKAHALGVQTGTVIRPSAIESPCPLAGRGALTPLHKGDGFPRQCEHWLEMTRAGRCGHRPIRNGTSRTPSPTKCRGCACPLQRNVGDAAPYE